MEVKNVMNAAESLMRQHGCHIHPIFISAEDDVQYVVRKTRTRMSMSPSFESIYAVCVWVLHHPTELDRNV